MHCVFLTPVQHHPVSILDMAIGLLHGYQYDKNVLLEKAIVEADLWSFVAQTIKQPILRIAARQPEKRMAMYHCPEDCFGIGPPEMCSRRVITFLLRRGTA